jgi:hypothetical protein
MLPLQTGKRVGDLDPLARVERFDTCADAGIMSRPDAFRAEFILSGIVIEPLVSLKI